ncbi:pectate lyase superfamily protein-domain-containing protein [Mycena sanguinolenta]|nr:pectate lyase superfamily protein-domain-containing protein [Mycena sanguinolenta]
MNTPELTALSKSAYKAGYKVFRNVKLDYHAVGNGIADDTEAINKAISDGGRCGEGCNSSTVTPAIVFFPPGKYRVTKPIIPYYYTSLVGDYNNKPTLLADSNFVGIAVIDADPYIPGEVGADGGGVNWWTNQNNFFRSVRNFVIDVSAVPPDSSGTGIHWQVGQATSLMNINFKMSSATGTKHQGIFMENGSGGFMSDLTFDGGAFGMWISNQQFTIRNVQITNAVSAIYLDWNWGFTWQNIQISNCQVGFDLNTGGLTLATQVSQFPAGIHHV